jgi:hypothetical protein
MKTRDDEWRDWTVEQKDKALGFLGVVVAVQLGVIFFLLSEIK